ncbi:MAG: right-handed parallel beta-helix repeat-containing protein [Sodaliphilus sp.]|nr:right-handed parallel beta-helix repeat-containing protein [Sodaliphilus sp.]
MRKTFTLLLAATAVATATAGYVSDGSKKVYTFESLSKIDTSGVKKVDGAYVVNEAISIAYGDTLRLQNGDVVKLADGVQVNIDGYADLTPSDTATVTRSAADAQPKGFRIYGDNASAVLKNVTFEYAGVAFGSDNGNLKADNCTFSYYNGKQVSAAALNFIRSSVGNEVTNCRFIESTTGALGNGANVPIGIVVKNNYFYHNNTGNSNRPQINLTCGGSSEAYNVEITGNKVIGGQYTKVGGIGVSNMLNLAHNCKVIIKDNDVEDNRYGVTVIGSVDVSIEDNKLINNKYETNDNNGGSGISIYSNAAATYVKGNVIDGNLWGVTLIGSSKNMNFGKVGDKSGDDYNPGENVFRNNGNGGVLYDLYNNTAETVYAQGNVWNVATQDSVSIEKVVFHKADNANLGQVIFMPAGKATGVEAVNVKAKAVYSPAIQAVVLPEAQQVAVYTMAGSLVAASQGKVSALSVEGLAPGVYVARTATQSLKFIKK